MSFYVDRNYRFAREEKFSKKIDIIRRTEVLKELQTIFRLSAIVGYYISPKNPGSKVEKSAEKIQLINFSETDYNFIDILAYNLTKNPNIVKKGVEDKIWGNKYTIYERYAKKGFPVFYKILDLDEDLLIYDEAEKYKVISKIINMLKAPQLIIDSILEPEENQND